MVNGDITISCSDGHDPNVEWPMYANHINKSAAKLRLIEYLHQEPLMASTLDSTLDTWVKNLSATFYLFCEHVGKLKTKKCIASNITVDDLCLFLAEAIMRQPHFFNAFEEFKVNVKAPSKRSASVDFEVAKKLCNDEILKTLTNLEFANRRFLEKTKKKIPISNIQI